MKIESFEDIEGWRKGRGLTRTIYELLGNHDFWKDYGVQDQITRASVSVMNNIAEGFDGGRNPEFIRFLFYAQRSATEVQSCLYVAVDNAYISEEDFRQSYSMAGEAKRLIGGLIKYLRSKKVHSKG